MVNRESKIANCKLQIANRKTKVVKQKLQIANCKLSIVNRKLQIANHKSQRQLMQSFNYVFCQPVFCGGYILPSSDTDYIKS